MTGPRPEQEDNEALRKARSEQAATTRSGSEHSGSSLATLFTRSLTG